MAQDKQDTPFLMTWVALKEGVMLTSMQDGRMPSSRKGYGAEFREPRRCPDTGVIFQGWRILRGTTISITPMSLHQNEGVFEHAAGFRPECWFAEDTKAIERHLLPGRRQCLGKNIAKKILNLAISTIYKNLEFGATQNGFDLNALKLFPSGMSCDIVVTVEAANVHCAMKWVDMLDCYAPG
ncbi:hypothetical protein EK21DRAFT_114982 [Setomelanomma holmii]|uniref:Cytochrome P450 n=1 Tax=Setomelanomma holmii TaxID=210430 RepID=A0A9P4H3J8_9PLEO|nr:hypothetical protein EK21DRAFT_114982 [Setomelanomma holmii]